MPQKYLAIDKMYPCLHQNGVFGGYIPLVALKSHHFSYDNHEKVWFVLIGTFIISYFPPHTTHELFFNP